MRFRFFLILILFFIISCKNKIDSQSSEAKISKKNNNSSFKLENFTYTDTLKGKTVWELISKNAIFNNKTQTVKLENVKIFYKNKYTIKSQKGEYSMNKKIAKLFDNVTINSENFTFYTDNLIFYSKKREIFSNNKIKLIGDNLFVKADSLKGFLDKKKFILKGNVYTEIR